MVTRLLLFVFALLCSATVFASPEIVFAVPGALSMPLADIRYNEVAGGILKDFGDAMAASLHRQARYHVLPRKRIGEALANGSVDAYCYARPDWLGVKAAWSRPVMSNSFIIVSGPALPALKSLVELDGVVVGTVYGYEYPDLDGRKSAYVRDDAPSVNLNVKKLMAKRFSYAALDGVSFDFAARAIPKLRNLAVLTVSKFETQCAFSPKSDIPLEEMNQAVDTLVSSGTMTRIIAGYK